MAEAPPPRSPLAALAGARLAAAAAGAEDVAHAGAEEVSLAERGPHMRLALRLEPEAAGARDAVRAVLGLAPPLAPNTAAAAAGRAVLWLGPDEWLATGPFDERSPRARALREALAGHHHAVTDVSAQSAVLVLSGGRAREVLAKGCRLDLHPRSFAPGACAQTTLAKAQVLLYRPGAPPAYEIAVRNSFAVYLATWLLDAMAEYRDGAS